MTRVITYAIDNYTFDGMSIDEAITKLQDIRAHYYNNDTLRNIKFIVTPCGFGGEGGVDINLSGERLETDKEEQLREAREKEVAVKNLEWKRKQYESLKKELGFNS